MYTLYKVSLLISLSSSKSNVGTTLGLEPMQNPPKGFRWGRGARRDVTSQDQVSQQMRKTLKQRMISLHEHTIEPQNTYRRVFQLGKRLSGSKRGHFSAVGTNFNSSVSDYTNRAALLCRNKTAFADFQLSNIRDKLDLG